MSLHTLIYDYVVCAVYDYVQFGAWVMHHSVAE